jgi:GNAT superfamily N-acetyltransferase
MNNQTGGLLRLTVKERDAGAAVLGRAFAGYDVFWYYFPDEKERLAAATAISFISVSVCLKYGEVYATSKKFEGVATWLPPGQSPFGARQVMRSVPPSVLNRFRSETSGFRAYARHIDGLHRKLVPYPHWYLDMIGVDPPRQGQGFSSLLLRPVLERLDRERIPCYLETNVEKNVGIYRRFGFDVIVEDKMPVTGLVTWAMVRGREPVDSSQ